MIPLKMVPDSRGFSFWLTEAEVQLKFSLEIRSYFLAVRSVEHECVPLEKNQSIAITPSLLVSLGWTAVSLCS